MDGMGSGGEQDLLCWLVEGHYLDVLFSHCFLSWLFISVLMVDQSHIIFWKLYRCHFCRVYMEPGLRKQPPSLDIVETGMEVGAKRKLLSGRQRCPRWIKCLSLIEHLLCARLCTRSLKYTIMFHSWWSGMALLLPIPPFQLRKLRFREIILFPQVTWLKNVGTKIWT